MSGLIENVTDPYGRKARSYPAFLTLLPLLGIVGLYTDWFSFQSQHAVLLLAAGAVLLFVSDFARRRGRVVEKKLLDAWGGYPSKTMLRHSDETLNPETKQRYHRAAERLIGSLNLPSKEEEESDCQAADAKYASVTDYLLTKTRDKDKFGMVFAENINYGFRRNLLGLKPLGLLSCGATFAVGIFLSWPEITSFSVPSGKELALIVGALGLIFVWCFLVSRSWVREAAEDYAQQLLGALDNLD